MKVKVTRKKKYLKKMESESFIGSSMKVKVEGSMKKEYLSAASTSSLAPNPTALAADIKPSVHRLGWKR